MRAGHVWLLDMTDEGSAPHLRCIGKPASSSAFLPATSENCMLLSRRRTIFLDTSSPGSKSLTSPAIRVDISEASNAVMVSTPDLPAHRLLKNVSGSCPTEDTTPKPLTTTRVCTACTCCWPRVNGSDCPASGNEQHTQTRRRCT